MQTRLHLQYNVFQLHNQLLHRREGDKSSWRVGTILITLRNYLTTP